MNADGSKMQASATKSAMGLDCAWYELVALSTTRGDLKPVGIPFDPTLDHPGENCGAGHGVCTRLQAICLSTASIRQHSDWLCTIGGQGGPNE